MKKSQTPAPDSRDLRRQAEERLRQKQKRKKPEASGPPTGAEALRLVHELQVHQIELEMQNEELVRARQEAEALLERYTDLYNFAPIGYFTLGRDGTIQQVNLTGARLLGQPRSRLVHGRLGLFVSEADRQAFNAFLERAFTSQVQESCEVSLLQAEENQLVVRIEGSASEDGQACRAVVADITERRRTEQARITLATQRQQAQKQESLGVLAGGIAHDFNNLLMGVLGNAELTLLELPAASPCLPYLTHIKTSALCLTEIAKQMLDYSGKGGFVVAPLNLLDLVTEMSSLLSVSLPKKIALQMELKGDLPAILANGSQIRQIVLNLITNAAEAIGDRSGLVTLRTGVMRADRTVLSQLRWHQELREGPYVYLEVSDTGCGISEEVLGKIFDPFFTTKFTGRGLGLAVVQGIVRGHQGAIQIHSQPGQGSTIRVLFPCAEPTSAQEAKPPVSRSDPCGAGQTVLVVDDEETVRTVVARMLETAGFAVLTARDGEEALTRLSQRSQDIAMVLLDLSMPRMDGLETFDRMREICAHLPIVLSSGYNEQEATRTFAGKGLSGFLQKPYGMESLLKKLVEACRPAPRIPLPTLGRRL